MSLRGEDAALKGHADFGMWLPVLLKCRLCGNEGMHVYQQRGPFILETSWRQQSVTGLTATDWTMNGDDVRCPKHQHGKAK